MHCNKDGKMETRINGLWNEKDSRTIWNPGYPLSIYCLRTTKQQRNMHTHQMWVVFPLLNLPKQITYLISRIDWKSRIHLFHQRRNNISTWEDRCSGKLVRWFVGYWWEDDRQPRIRFTSSCNLVLRSEAIALQDG